MTDLRAEMSLFDRMHPRCRAAIANAPYDFNLLSMPQTVVNLAIGNPDRASPGRFIAWLEGEIEAARLRYAASA